jgi:dihydroorotate dehydrogenase electron transfer subunit
MSTEERNPLHAAYYADRAVHETVEIVENVRLARDTYRVRFYSPVIASRIVPGQFLMLRLTGLNDPLIGRPLALYDTVPSASRDPEAIDVVYVVKGKLTSRLWQMLPGQQLDVWGPLGNGFGGSGFRDQGEVRGQSSGVRGLGKDSWELAGDKEYSVPGTEYSVRTADQPAAALAHHSPSGAHHLLLVAGGIGYTPFLALAQEALGNKQYGDPPRKAPRAQRVTFCYGARSADYLAGVEDFERLGIDVRVATDDGSRGHHGFVTDLLRQVLTEEASGQPHVVCCGPEPMMEAAAGIAREHGASCEVSLETPMACGVGICFTCVAKVKQADGTWDYKRTCVDGPVFDAELIEW